MESDGSLTLYNLVSQETTIQERIGKILSTEEEISDIYDKHKVPLDDSGRSQDMDDTHQFILTKQIEVAKCKEQLKSIEANSGHAPNSDLSREELLRALSKINSNPTTVILECKDFYGSDSDKYSFNQWLAQLFTVIKTNPSWDDSAKLTYLKSKVKGFASNVIRPVQHGAGSFKQALDALKHHFLNKEANRDQLFNKLLSISPAFCPKYSKTTIYITEVRAILLDLKNHYQCDLTVNGSGGNQLISHLVFAKLSIELQNALILKSGTQFPTFDQIYNLHVNEIFSLTRIKAKKAELNNNNHNHSKESNYNKIKRSMSKPISSNSDNFASAAAKVQSSSDKFKDYHCKFCNVDGHSNSYCLVYATLEARRARCEEIGLCSLCTMENHPTDRCHGKQNNLRFPCRNCHKRSHIAAMCDKGKTIKQESTHVCLSTSVLTLSNYLLPVLKVEMKGHNGKIIKFNCLFDTASSRSYISNSVSDQMGLHQELVKDVEYSIKTFFWNRY